MPLSVSMFMHVHKYRASSNPTMKKQEAGKLFKMQKNDDRLFDSKSSRAFPSGGKMDA